jgi:hypothetical protein
MDMVRDATDALSMSVEALDDATEVGMEFVPPRGCDRGFAVFGRENQMVMETGVRGGHAQLFLAPLPGCGCFGDSDPVVSLRSTTGYRM